MEVDGEDERTGHAWEEGVEATWESVHADVEVSLANHQAVRRKRRRLEHQFVSQVRRGMMRYLCVVLDFSRAMADNDLRPNRLECALDHLEGFIREFFDQNPVSHLSILITRNGRCEKRTDLSGNLVRHLDSVQEMKRGVERFFPSGDASLQNTLQVGQKLLLHMPTHASREMLIIMASLSSCDAADVFETIKEVKGNQIKCSVISLSAQVFLCSQLCEQTGGDYHVALDAPHFQDLLMKQVQPPISPVDAPTSIIKMGFPKRQDLGFQAKCICHETLANTDAEVFQSSGYLCPRCKSMYCDLPVECRICGLLLVESPHLARSFHHLFPLEPFSEVPAEPGQQCPGCLATFGGAESLGYRCPDCRKVFCFDCDAFAHEVLHNCPGCH